MVDNYSNSSPAALAAIRKVSGKDVVAYAADLRDTQALDDVFAATIGLVEAMFRHGVRKLVFSGSCSIFGGQYSDPIPEDYPTGPTNPYARTKLMCEQILEDACRRWPDLSVVSLRYFNPVGAHPSGDLGEDPKGIPSNILPYMMQVAVGRLERLQVFGDDYDTPDGTGVRDYIHVMDVAEARCVAMEHPDDAAGMRAFNIGTGTGVSVLELIATFQQASNVIIPYEIIGRQFGDVDTLIADPSRIEKEWSWHTSRDLRAMCSDA